MRGIYVVAVNDAFVVNAWKDKIASGSEVHFVADATVKFSHDVGLTFNAAGLLGNIRSKRYVMVVDNGVVQSVDVEDDAPNVTVSSAENALKRV